MKLREPRCDSEYGRLAQRMAKLEEKLYEVRQRNARLEQENARLRAEAERLGKENSQLQQQLAAARKNSSTSSKATSSDIVKPKKPRGEGGKKRKNGLLIEISSGHGLCLFEISGPKDDMRRFRSVGRTILDSVRA